MVYYWNGNIISQKWMLQRTLFDEKNARYHPYKLLPDKQNTYEMAERFGISIKRNKKRNKRVQ